MASSKAINNILHRFSVVAWYGLLLAVQFAGLVFNNVCCAEGGFTRKCSQTEGSMRTAQADISADVASDQELHLPEHSHSLCSALDAP